MNKDRKKGLLILVIAALLAVTAAALYTGASLVRVHDVKENIRMIRMLEAIRKA